jgi:hypothetical protein
MLNLIRNTVSNFRLTKAKQDANNFLAAAGITGQVQSQAIYNLVNDLQASGLWSKMKAVYPMVTDNRNLLSYTENYSVGVWNKNNVSVTVNDTIAPNGTLTGNKIVANSASADYIYQTLPTLTNGQVYTISRYVKAGTLNFCTIGLHGLADAYFDLVNLTYSFSGAGAISASITDVGNGWRRISATYTFTGSTYNVYFAMASSLSSSAGITIGAFQYTWGTQIELGSTASTYQPILTTPAAFMASQMKYNLKDARDLDAAFRLTWSGGWTYSATGATPNGTNAYADSNLIPSTNLTESSKHLSFYLRTDNTPINADPINIGALSGSPRDFLAASRTKINGQLSSILAENLTITNPIGYSLITRSSTTNNLFKNNSKVATSSGSGTSPNVKVFVGALNLNGGAYGYTNNQLAFSSIGDGLTDQDSQLLNQIVEKYQVALSRGVQAAQSFYYNSAYSNEANTYLYSTQITGTTQVSAINTLINGLKANNLWAKMKAVYPFVTDYINLLSYTEDFSNAAWGKNNSTVTSNSATAPNGTLTADTIADTVTNQAHSIYQSGNTINTGAMVGSVYLKDNGRRYAVVSLATGTSGQIRYSAVVDLQNGIITQNNSLNSPTNTSSSITNIGNGWYRISVKLDCTIVQNNSNYIIIATSNTGTPSTFSSGTLDPQYVGDGSSIFIWGAQLELSTSASVYQAVLGTQQSTIAAQMKFNLVNPQDSDAAFRLAFSGGWTYSTNGAQPNGTNGYADTKLVPNTNLTLNSVSFSAYSRNNFTPTIDQSLGCGSGASNLPLLGQSFTSLKDVYSFIYSYSVPDVMISSPNQNLAAMFLSTRTAANNAKSFRNTTQLASVTTQAQTTQPTNNFFFGAFNGALGIINYSSFQYAFAHIGTGLSDAEAALLYQLIQEYQTTLSRQV